MFGPFDGLKSFLAAFVCYCFLLPGVNASPELPNLSNTPVIGGPCEGCDLVYQGMPGWLDLSGKIATQGEAGETLIVTGKVTRQSGAAARGVIVYAYQTNADGVYPPGPTWHGNLRGWALTNAQGEYQFQTIRPGSYPERDEPQHIHMHVVEPGVGTYYIDNIEFSDDPLRQNTTEIPSSRGGSGLVNPVRDAQEIWRVRRDIVLGLNIPGYPESP